MGASRTRMPKRNLPARSDSEEWDGPLLFPYRNVPMDCHVPLYEVLCAAQAKGALLRVSVDEIAYEQDCLQQLDRYAQARLKRLSGVPDLKDIERELIKKVREITNDLTLGLIDQNVATSCSIISRPIGPACVIPSEDTNRLYEIGCNVTLRLLDRVADYWLPKFVNRLKTHAERLLSGSQDRLKNRQQTFDLSPERLRNFAANIPVLNELCNWDVPDLVAASGTSKATIYKVMACKTKPGKRTRDELSQAYAKKLQRLIVPEDLFQAKLMGEQILTGPMYARSRHTTA